MKDSFVQRPCSKKDLSVTEGRSEARVRRTRRLGNFREFGYRNLAHNCGGADEPLAHEDL